MTVPAMWSWLQLALLVVLGWSAHAEAGCPPPEDIEPCHCTDFPSTRLTCSNLKGNGDLRSVFKNSEGYFFHEVWIRSASMLFIPHDIFDRTEVGELFIVDSNFVALFDSPLRSTKSLYKIQIDNTIIQQRNLFDQPYLKNLTSLRTLVVNRASFNKIPEDFASKLPSSLRQITFNGTAIRRIEIGAFNGLENLDKFVLSFSNMNNLTRGMFPRPFNVRFLYLDNNNISSLAEDLFTEMPNLQFVTLRHNSLTAVPKEVFGERSTNVPFLGLEGNPLNCNCLLVWLIKDKPEVIDGTCSKPSRLQGKRLQDLAPADFNC